MNGAIKYFREHGLKKSKKHLLDIREAANQVSWVHSLEGFSQGLKRLVESHELVESVPRGYEGLKSCLDYCDPKFCLFHSEKYKQAIADVEACKEVS